MSFNERQPVSRLALPANRRRLVGLLSAGAGGLLLVRALPVWARDDGHDDDHAGEDDSGRGRGRGRGRGGDENDGENGDNSGSGNAEEQAAIAADLETAAAALPAGAQLVRIESDDAGGFVPGELTIDRGQTVAFLNGHGDEHTATGSGFDTGIIDSGQIATITLDTAGSFPYACQIHPEMTGVIRVRDDDGRVPGTPPAATPVAAGSNAIPVRIADLAFDPARLSVRAGEAVTWTNADQIPHTVTADDRAFDSGILAPGATFSHVFAEPGVVAYHCDLHPSMLATVEVSGAGAANATPEA